jgi:hypothetical protein
VLTAIDLDHQPLVQRCEIDDELAQGMLSAELGAVKLPVAQLAS